MIIMIIIIIIIIEKSFHANFRSYGSRARFELRESRAAGLFREETRRSVRRREERQRGGEGEGGILSRHVRARIRTPLLSSTTTTNARTTTRSFLCRPVLGNNLHRLFVPLSALSRNKERISFFPPRSCGKKRKREREGKGKEGRKEGRRDQFFQRRPSSAPFFHVASMCVRFVVD